MTDPARENHLTALDMEIVSATSSEVVIRWTVSSKHHQPHGIVHGGVYCSAIETACSIGASISASERTPGASAVGLENHTSFIRAVREGTLTATARPITRGRTSQVWECEVKDEQGRVTATGRVRLLCVTPDQISSAS
jgi:1,4-dihydroxy-2-naphthoyl-CoA hydrolase